MTTPSSTAIPNRAMKPIQIAVFICTSAIAIATIPAANETGMAEKIVAAMEKFLKLK